MAEKKVAVLFLEDYTVKNDDADSYRSGQVYEMTEAQAALFSCWCDCEVTDRKPTAQPVRTGKRPPFSRRPPKKGPRPLFDPKLAAIMETVLGKAPAAATRNG